jgi:hypothetical protein
MEFNSMKLMRLSFAALLAFSVGVTLPAFAQHDQDGDSRHERDKDEGKGRGHGHGDRGEHGRDDRGGHEGWRDGDRHEDHDRHEWREHERHEARERHEEHEWREHEWREHNHDHYVYYVGHHRHYIPEDHFYAHFGREHRFVIVRTVYVERRPRFRYGGYWFVIGRPLPPDWRDDDEVYVDFIDDGYYVCNPRHPGVHISVDIM